MFSSGRTSLVTTNPLWMELINKPREYDLVNSEEKSASPSVLIYVIGCAGDLESAQQQVADLMNKIANATQKPLAIFLVGDNFYHIRLKKLDDAAFQKNFYDVYHRAEMTGICGVPFFAILGNHDHDLDTFWRNNGAVDYDVAGLQVMHTYLDEAGAVSAAKIAEYEQKTLDLSRLRKWNMPSRYYVLRYQAIEFYLIDSNTYIKDYLQALKNPEDMNNQANWLRREFKRNSQHTKLLFLHHALATVGKRIAYTADHSDTRMYLSPAEVEILKKAGIEGSYGDMLRMVLKSQGLVFDSVFAAHDHAMYYYRYSSAGENFCQVITGGGGGSLQSRVSFHQWEVVPVFMKEHGFVAVTIDAASPDKKILFDFYSVQGSHLRFSHLDSSPVRANLKRHPGVSILHEIVLKAYEKYFNQLRISQKDASLSTWATILDSLRHGEKGVIRADSLRNYFNGFEDISFADAVKFVIDLFASSSTRYEASLKTCMENELFSRFKMKWEDFVSKPEAIISLPPLFRTESPSESKSLSGSGVYIERGLSFRGTPKDMGALLPSNPELELDQLTLAADSPLNGSPVLVSRGSPVLKPSIFRVTSDSPPPVVSASPPSGTHFFPLSPQSRVSSTQVPAIQTPSEERLTPR